MKGIVFTEFLEMVEAELSPALLEDLIDEANLASGGAYTAVGNYPYEELLTLARLVAARTGTTESALLKRFGERIFKTYWTRYHRFFRDVPDAYNFFEQVENHIHREVRKIYPDAEHPSFEIERRSSSHYSIIYNSPRPLGDLCEGLIVAVLRHFDENMEFTRTPLQTSPVTRIRFDFIRRGVK